MNDARKYCAKCKHRETCTEPCAPVEALLKEVMTRPENRGKLTKEFIDSYNHFKPFSTRPRNRTKKQMIIDMYFIDDRNQCDIAYLADCSKQYMSKVIRDERFKRKRGKAM